MNENGRMSLLMGGVKIRQVYARTGHSYCAITVPKAIMQAMKWEPGIILTYFPTKDRALKLMDAQALEVAMPDIDISNFPEPEPWKNPRDGSYAEREVDVEKQAEELIERMRLSKLLREEDTPTSRKKKKSPSRRRR